MNTFSIYLLNKSSTKRVTTMSTVEDLIIEFGLEVVPIYDDPYERKKGADRVIEGWDVFNTSTGGTWHSDEKLLTACINASKMSRQ